jgi:hypothetical protein
MTTASFHCGGNYSCDRLRSEIYLNSGVTYCGRATKDKTRYTGKFERLISSKAFIPAKMSNMEVEGNCRKSMDNRPK